MAKDRDTEDMELTPVEVETLIMLLERGDNSPKNISKYTDRHRKTVSRKLSDLADRGYVENKGSGVYALTTSGVLLAQSLKRDRDP